jgi:hypothetical protein
VTSRGLSFLVVRWHCSHVCCALRQPVDRLNVLARRPGQGTSRDETDGAALAGPLREGCCRVHLGNRCHLLRSWRNHLRRSTCFDFAHASFLRGSPRGWARAIPRRDARLPACGLVLVPSRHAWRGRCKVRTRRLANVERASPRWDALTVNPSGRKLPMNRTAVLDRNFGRSGTNVKGRQ